MGHLQDAGQDILSSPGGAPGLVVLALLYCFLGYRLVRLIIAVTGFVLAAGCSYELAGMAFPDQPIALAIAAFLGGLVGAFALFFAYKVGIFCLGAIGGAVLAGAALSEAAVAWALWAVLGASVLGGILALLIERFMLVLATAAIGATLFVQVGAAALESKGVLDAEQLRWASLAAWLLLTGVGAGVQLHGLRKRSTREQT